MKLLIVEDNPGDLMLIEHALNEAGLCATIEHYDTAEKAIGAINNYADENAPGAMLLDYNLPGGTAREMLAAAAANPALKHSKKAVLTCSVDPRDKEQSIAAGADLFIYKPSDLDAFIGEVGNAMKRLFEPEVGMSVQE